MSQVRNRHYFIFFSIFFVVCSPFLVFLSFGYDVNFRDQSVSNTTTVKVDTFPKNALIKVRNETKGTAPTELYSQDSDPFNITISSPKYLNENFLIAPSVAQNTSVDLRNLFLLPKDAETFKSINANKSDFESLIFLNKDQIITKSTDGFQIRDFGVGGFVNFPLGITEKEPEVGKPDQKLTLSKPTEEFLNNDKKEWKKLGEGVFYKNNYLLQKKSDNWLIRDIASSFSTGIKRIVKLDQNNYLVLDNSKNMWILNGKITKFVDSGFDSIFATISPEFVWILKNNSIYRLKNTDLLTQTVDWKSGLLLKSELINSNEGEIKIMPLFQGVGIQVGPKIFYVPDFATDSWILLTNNAKSFYGDNNSIFWLDSDNYPNFYNLLTLHNHIFPKISDEYTEISYFPEWNRIMFYGADKVATIWFNKEIFQPNISSYSNQDWIVGSNCFPRIIEKVQYCIRDRELSLYKNNLLF